MGKSDLHIATEWDDEVQVGYVHLVKPGRIDKTVAVGVAGNVDLCDGKPVGVEVLYGTSDTLMATAFGILARWVRSA